MPRTRQHVIITRLNDAEYAMYQRILTRVRTRFSYPKNDSEAFRLALRIMNKKLSDEAALNFYDKCLDFGVNV